MRFTQVDVFADGPLLGNPLAVVHDAEGLTDQDMAAFARWTNLSETTFLLPPTRPDADYRVCIWTPGGELPFAGHPTLGSAHAWLEAGGTPREEGVVVQECAVGLVTVLRAERLAFAAPPLIRDGDVDPDLVARLARGLALRPADVAAARWVDNGPGWVGLRLRDAAAVLAVEPDWAALGDAKVGLVGAHTDEDAARLGADVEVRALIADRATEDPVTGSLNAALAPWLLADGVVPARYVAAQGTRVHRRGRVHLDATGEQVWVGGDVHTRIAGSLDLT